MKSEFQKKRMRAIRFLSNEHNRLIHEAVFDEDYDKADKYKQIIDLLHGLCFSQFGRIKICPVCGSKNIYVAKIDKALFTNTNTHRRKTLSPVHIRLCGDCGYMMPAGVKIDED